MFCNYDNFNMIINQIFHILVNHQNALLEQQLLFKSSLWILVEELCCWMDYCWGTRLSKSPPLILFRLGFKIIEIHAFGTRANKFTLTTVQPFMITSIACYLSVCDVFIITVTTYFMYNSYNTLIELPY